MDTELRDEIDRVKASINLVTLIGGDLKKKTAREFSRDCPFCGGTDRFNINTDKNAWMCRHCIKEWEQHESITSSFIFG